VIVLVAVATMTALNNSNRATALTRARAQANALAEQNEDELHGEPIAKLSEMSKSGERFTHSVSSGGTNYTVFSSAKYIDDATSTASCSSSSPSADYIRTISEVSWHGNVKPVVETGIVAPPPDSSIIVQVSGAAGEPVAGMTAEATGPTSTTAETAADGCAILAVSPGEYKVNVDRLGYVDQNGFKNSSEDPSTTGSFYVIAEQTVKKSFEFAPAGTLSVGFENTKTKTITEGWDQFYVFNPLMTHPRASSFGTLETFPGPPSEVSSGATLFPFTSKYTVAAGSCEADLPTKNGQAANVEILVAPGATTKVVVPVAPITLNVTSGTSSGFPGSPILGFTGTLTDGCGAAHKFTATTGQMPRPAVPFGTYSLCVTTTISGKPRKTTISVPNNSTTGTTAATIYLGAGEEKAGCP